VQLVSKISNLCDPDPPTLQTDGQTDRRHAISIPRYALVHRAVIIIICRSVLPTNEPAADVSTGRYSMCLINFLLRDTPGRIVNDLCGEFGSHKSGGNFVPVPPDLWLPNSSEIRCRQLVSARNSSTVSRDL